MCRSQNLAWKQCQSQVNGILLMKYAICTKSVNQTFIQSNMPRNVQTYVVSSSRSLSLRLSRMQYMNMCGSLKKSMKSPRKNLVIEKSLKKLVNEKSLKKLSCQWKVPEKIWSLKSPWKSWSMKSPWKNNLVNEKSLKKSGKWKVPEKIWSMKSPWKNLVNEKSMKKI